MVTTLGAWSCVGAIVAMSACGGEAFVFGDASPDVAAPDAAAPVDASQDGTLRDVSPSNLVLCPNKPCQSQTCCTMVSAPNSSNCTGGACGCSTQLDCWSDANCAGAMTVCCIGSRTDTQCGSSHFVAQCRVACLTGESRLCDPNASHCASLKPACSVDSGDLQNVGLPPGQGYGVCK
jgi:hypothetical protein